MRNQRNRDRGNRRGNPVRKKMKMSEPDQETLADEMIVRHTIPCEKRPAPQHLDTNPRRKKQQKLDHYMHMVIPDCTTRNVSEPVEQKENCEVTRQNDDCETIQARDTDGRSEGCEWNNDMCRFVSPAGKNGKVSEKAVGCEVIPDCVTTDKESETPALYGVIQNCGTTESETANREVDMCRFTSSAGKNGQVSEEPVWCEVIPDCVTTDPESETAALYGAIQDCGTTVRETANIESDLCRFTSSAGKNGLGIEKAVWCEVIPDCVKTVRGYPGPWDT